MGTNATYGVNLFLENFIFEAHQIFIGHYFPFMLFVLGFAGIIMAIATRKTRAYTLALLTAVLLVFILYLSFPYGQQTRYFIITHWIFIMYALFFAWELIWSIGEHIVRWKLIKKILALRKPGSGMPSKKSQNNQRLKKNESLVKYVFCVLALMIISAITLPAMIHDIKDYQLWPASYLATRTGKSLDNDFSHDCFIVTQREEATIIGASVHQKIIQADDIMSNMRGDGIKAINELINSSACVLYYKGLICTRDQHSPAIFGESEKEMCKFADESFELENIKNYNYLSPHQNLTFSIFRLKHVNYPVNGAAINATLAMPQGK